MARYSRPMTADEWRLRLGELVESRITELGLEYTEVAQRAGFSVETLSKIRGGRFNIKPVTYSKLERALRWQHGSVSAVRAGGMPLPQKAPTGQASPEPGTPDPARDPRVAAMLTILDELPVRLRLEVLQQLGDRLPPAARAELDAETRHRKAG